MNETFLINSKSYEEFDETPNKEIAIRDEVFYKLCQTNSMFRWEGLPETIPVDKLELFLQVAGSGVFARNPKDDKIYFFTGGTAPAPLQPPMTPYYEPTGFIVNNPFLDLSKTFNTNEFDENQEAVFCRNDVVCQGLMPAFRKYATRLIENEITLFGFDINMRDTHVFEASDNKTYLSAKEWQKEIRKGKDAVILAAPFMEGLKTHEMNSSSFNAISTLLEYNQYLKTDLYHSLGLNSCINPFKKEAISTAETTASEDVLLPNIDDMLRQRRRAAEQLNKVFGLNVTVEKNSSWEYKQLEVELATEQMEENVGNENQEEVSETETETTEEVKEEEVNETD